jgi:hypothetical protein
MIIEPSPNDHNVDDGQREVVGMVVADDNVEIDPENMDPRIEDEDDDESVPDEDDWEWVDEPVADVTETILRGRTTYSYPIPTFLGPRSGPRNIPAGCESELDYFRLFFDDEIMDTFVTNTNTFSDSQTVKMRETTKDELFKLLACIMYMGICSKPRMRHHFDRTFFGGSPFCMRAFKGQRFEMLLSRLHWLNTSVLSEAEKARMRAADGFWNISSFLKRLSDNFAKHFSIGQSISIDEKTIRFKGHHRCRCFNPNKPNKYHLKAFCANDAATGYCHRFFMYQGATEVRPDDVPATLYPIVKLLENEEYHHKNNILSTDNWYTTLMINELRITMLITSQVVGQLL